MKHSFGSRRIYYNNFAEHLLNRFNPNMTYPGLPYRWQDKDWEGVMDMIADYGFNVFEFWLAPRLFCREALESDFATEYARQIKVAANRAHQRGLKVEMLCSLVTSGTDWISLCPNSPEEWQEVRFLWKSWVEKLDCVDIFCIFPGDPGCCSRNGCTAETYIDKSIEIANMIKEFKPDAEFEFNTWGPPFFGWGIIEFPENYHGEFIREKQASAWKFNKERMEKSMQHLYDRLEDFPENTCFSINLGFNPDGIPEGDSDARQWAKRISGKAPVLTWDFSLTEGENGIFPHFRFQRLFEQRKREREVDAYSGGICFTMTPLLNALSLYESAHSFINPDDDYNALAKEFYEKTFGTGAGEIVEDLILFEIIPEWGNHVKLDITRQEYHRRMNRFVERVASWQGRINGSLKIYPSAEFHRSELEFFGKIFRDLSADTADFDAIRKCFYDHVYHIYDFLPAHVDSRAFHAANSLIRRFAYWNREDGSVIPGKWV